MNGNTSDDRVLLRRFGQDGCEAAFAELVRRHLDLVYSTALRLVRDPQLAEDVCQEVFADLARKASRLPETVVPAGWLYRSARFAASKAVRTEVRRRAREVAAMQMPLHDDSAEPTPDWEALRPLLDSVMDELSESDRDAVVMRFFQQQDLRSVGRALGLGEEAARKRVTRALERLRDGCVRRGLTTTTGGLAAVLASQAIHAAPAGLAATVVSSSLTAATVVATGGVGATLVHAAFMTKAKVTLVAAAALACAAVPLVLQHRAIEELRAENSALRQQAATPPADPEPAAHPATSASPSADGAPAPDKAELLRLRGEVARLRSENRDLTRRTQPRNISPFARARLATPREQDPGYIPAEQLADAGTGTPEAALQTFFWALQHPESGKIVDVLALPEELKQLKARGGVAVRTLAAPGAPGAGATYVAESGSADAVPRDNFKVDFQIGDAGPDAASPGNQLQGYRVLSQVDVSPDEKKVELEREMKDGTTRVESHTLQKDGDSWRVKPGSGGMAVIANRIEAHITEDPRPTPRPPQPEPQP